MKKFSNLSTKYLQKGFSIAQVTMVMGALAAVSLIIAKTQQNTNKMVKNTDIKSEELTIEARINQILLDSDACVKTLLQAGSIGAGGDINAIKDRNGTDVYKLNNSYGGDSVSKIAITKGLDVDEEGEIELAVKLNRKSTLVAAKEITYKFDIHAKTDSSGKVDFCYASVDSAIQKATDSACESIGGDTPNGKDICNLAKYGNALIDNFTGVSTQYLEDFMSGGALDNYFIKKTGDTTTGKLTIENDATVYATNDISSMQLLCVGTNCRDFTTKTCKANEVMYGINAFGAPICVPLSNLCPASYYFVGFSSTYSPVCSLLPNKGCPVNQYITAINNTNVVCSPIPTTTTAKCPNGSYLEAINGGIPVCKLAVVASTCPVGQLPTGIYGINKQLRCTDVSSTIKGTAIYRGPYGTIHTSATAEYRYNYATICTKKNLDFVNMGTVSNYLPSTDRYEPPIPCPPGFDQIAVNQYDLYDVPLITPININSAANLVSATKRYMHTFRVNNTLKCKGSSTGGEGPSANVTTTINCYGLSGNICEKLRVTKTTCRVIPTFWGYLVK